MLVPRCAARLHMEICPKNRPKDGEAEGPPLGVERGSGIEEDE